MLGRAFAVLESSYWVTTGVGAMLCPLLIALAGARGALVIVGLCLPATRRAARACADGLRGRIARAGAGVRDAAVENLSRRVGRLPVAGGDVLFRAGDDGDRFYVVASGELLLTRDGIEISRAAPGGFFGEIALEREDFIGTITGNVRSSQAADALITARS